MEITNREKQFLNKCYEDVLSGSSLRKLEEQYRIPRKKLKKLIEEILTEEEMERFKEAVQGKNYKNKHSEERKSQKKNRAMESADIKDKIQKLEGYGITIQKIDNIYYKAQQNEKTKIAKDTLILKLVDLLDIFDKIIKKVDSNEFSTTSYMISIVEGDLRLLGHSMDYIKSIIKQVIIKNNDNIKLALEEIQNNPRAVFEKRPNDKGGEENGRVFTDDAKVSGKER